MFSMEDLGEQGLRGGWQPFEPTAVELDEDLARRGHRIGVEKLTEDESSLSRTVFEPRAAGRRRDDDEDDADEFEYDTDDDDVDEDFDDDDFEDDFDDDDDDDDFDDGFDED